MLVCALRGVLPSRMPKAKTPAPRPARHDDLVAIVLSQAEHLWPEYTGRFGDSPLPVGAWAQPENSGRARPEVIVERPCGAGYIDLWIGLVKFCDCGSQHPGGLIVEVKSELEQWSAGDVLRQLKRYMAEDRLEDRPRRYARTRETCNMAPYSIPLLASGRALTAAEIVLLDHECVDYVLL